MGGWLGWLRYGGCPPNRGRWFVTLNSFGFERNNPHFGEGEGRLLRRRRFVEVANVTVPCLVISCRRRLLVSRHFPSEVTPVPRGAFHRFPGRLLVLAAHSTDG